MNVRAMLITVIGRGHSGTRVMSHTLSASGVFMGSPLNPSGDLLPPEAMYAACRVLARHVRWLGGLAWDWSDLHRREVEPEFTALIQAYLQSVLESPAPAKGWKIPETSLVFPWITRLFPEAYYIYWLRDPRDCLLDGHLTDDLREWGVQYPEPDELDPGVDELTALRLRRAISWKYQYDLVQAAPKPARWIEVRFEDFVLKQEETLRRLEDYLGLPLARIPVNPEAVGRWKLDEGVNCFDFLAPAMYACGYG